MHALIPCNTGNYAKVCALTMTPPITLLTETTMRDNTFNVKTHKNQVS